MTSTENQTAIAKPTIELRKFKHAAFASEETTCFEAEVWVNAVRAFRARNDGKGGMTFFDPIIDNWNDKQSCEVGRARMQENEDILEQYAKSLPVKPWPAEWKKEGGMEQNVESLINDAVHEKLGEKIVEKYMRAMKEGRKVYFVDGGALRYISYKGNPVMPPERLAGCIADVRKRHAGAVVLNTLSDADARQQLAKLV
jgi:hypothetical protein